MSPIALQGALEQLMSVRWRLVLALVLGVYLLVVLVQRFRTGEDPSLRMQTESAAGTTSLLFSGTHVTIALVVALGLLLLPELMQSAVLAAVFVGVVAVHYILEKREVDWN